MRTSWGSATDRGLVREVNEDALLAYPPVFLVADGMGGHDAGDLASRIAVEEFAQLAGQAAATADDVHACFDRTAARIRTEFTGGRQGGTTVAGVAVTEHDGGSYWLVFNVGDSRVYLWSGDDARAGERRPLGGPGAARPRRDRPDRGRDAPRAARADARPRHRGPAGARLLAAARRAARPAPHLHGRPDPRARRRRARARPGGDGRPAGRRRAAGPARARARRARQRQRRRRRRGDRGGRARGRAHHGAPHRGGARAARVGRDAQRRDRPAPDARRPSRSRASARSAHPGREATSNEEMPS